MTGHQSDFYPLPVNLASDSQSYRPPLWLRSGHLQSVWPTLFRHVELMLPRESVLTTEDGDELHLDWYEQGSERLAILSHGLEGHSRRPYILGLARALLADGWDVLAWNFRSCGGHMNHLPRFYHSGSTEDLRAVVQAALGYSSRYRCVGLSGFSMGGNLTMLYLAQEGEQLDSRIRGGLTFSVPCDLAGSASILARPSRKVYMQRFLRDLHVKMKEKARRFPDVIDIAGYEQIRSFQQFDDRYTAPLHGYRDAEDYWSQASCLPRLPEIRVPSLIVNAVDDPFLSPSCFPCKKTQLGDRVRFEAPRWGGHVGFVELARDGYYWSERRALQFFRGLV